ncbi:MAG: hypothetical protein ACYTG4_01810 [Planctomycetota bacterium]
MKALRYVAVGVGYIPADFISRPPEGWNVRTAPPSFFTKRDLPEGALTLSLVRDDVPFAVIIAEDPGMDPEVAYRDQEEPVVGSEALDRLLTEQSVVRHLVRSILEKGTV